MIRIWKIAEHKTKTVDLQDMSSLDAITRQLPDGYYSTFRTFAGCTRVLGLKTHLRRLYKPMSQADTDAATLRQNLLQLLEPYRPGETRIRIMMTKQGQVYVAIEPLRLLPSEVYQNGVRVETTQIHRVAPRLKTTAFIGASNNERKHLAHENIFEALLVKNGKLLEGMTSNFFYVLGNILYTAQRDILLGVTRRTVIRVARSRGVDVKYKPLELIQLSAVKEAFITSSSRGIVPVIQIDAMRVGQGQVGSLTKKLMSAYESNVLKNSEKI